MTLAALIRAGQLCASCNSECRDASGVAIECVACDGAGCTECIDGRMEITGCPRRQCSSVVGAVQCIDLFGKGIPPVAGGSLDQSQSFIDAARYFQNAEARLKYEQ